MNNSGDAAEQVVRMSLEGTEVALKLTGSAAKNIAAAIYAVYKNRDKDKIRGRQRLTAMLKSGKELKVFTINEEHLKQFAVEAKRYGVVYCALRGKGKSEDGLVDVMVRAEDASKINRIVERFKLATVDAASIKHEIERAKTEEGKTPAVPEQTAPEKSSEDALLDDMLGAPTKKEERTSPNPLAAGTEKSPPSAPTSGTPSKAAEGTAKKADGRPSVRAELREIQQKRRQEPETPKRTEPAQAKKTPAPTTVEHKPPRKKNKSKVR